MAMNNPNPPTSQDYDYTQAGLDNFLGRAIDQVSWQTTLDAALNMPGSETLTTLPGATTQINYDSAMLSGSAGNTQTIGNMTLDPTANTMTLNDGTIQING